MFLPCVTCESEVDSLRAGHQLVDMHFHTRSSDGLATPQQALARAVELDLRVAITDHNVIDGVLAALELAGEEHAARVVPGLEITTLERLHLLVYFRRAGDLEEFHRRSVAPHRSSGASPLAVLPRPACELLDELEPFEHLSSAAHPFAVARNGWMTVRERHSAVRDELGRLDAIEVLNGEELDAGNLRASELARERGLGSTAGSDGHTLGELGRVGLACPRGEELFEASRKGSCRLFDLRPPGAWRRLAVQAAKAPYYARQPARVLRNLFE